MSVSEFFPDWLRARAATRREPVIGAPRWDEVHDEFGPDGCGLLYVLLTVAHGRRQFAADPRDVQALVDMDPERFGELVMQFVRARWIELELGGDGATWTILREPQGWAQP
jgi:hypothetical protein